MAEKGGLGTGMNMTEEEKYYWEAFNLFDKDGSGSICKDEFGKATRALGFNPTDQQIADLLKQYDTNNTDRLEFVEFKTLIKELYKKNPNDKNAIRNAFKVLDRDQSGYIEAKELKEVLQKCGQSLSDDEISEMIAVADSNKDGKINYNEFTEYMCRPIK
ncbi:neo-calmodulin-like [Ruditapes philippinarum]|uniref:neo-calmodulin-like n=1 Tax=Ruditapes philippinarum TaxID=129788 RepID=UPI00295B2D6A|nr:neo-calmodulin-like [Ruditapes philippinarum]